MPNRETIFSRTARHCVALFSNTVEDLLRGGSGKNIINQGTMTLVKYGKYCLGITNEHVVSASQSAGVIVVNHLALRRHEPLPGRLLFTSTKENPDCPYDIGIFLIFEPIILAGGKVPYTLDINPQPLRVGELALAVGFPGAERTVGPRRAAHPLYHVASTCNASTDRQIILRDNIPSKDRRLKFGGMSGGPIFRETDDNGCELVGIVFQGRGFADSENLNPQDEIWVWGFPINTAVLDYALDWARREHGDAYVENMEPLKVSINLKVMD